MVDTNLDTLTAVELRAEVEGLREALRSRTVIGQATGILMERYKLTPDAAWTLLVRCSQESNRKVRDIAARMTSGAEPYPERHCSTR